MASTFGTRQLSASDSPPHDQKGRDLPGGRIENKETPPHALARERHEELGIVVLEPTEPLFAHLHRSNFDYRVWIVTEWVGTPRDTSDEQDDAGWWSPNSIGDLALADESYRRLIERALRRVWA